MSDIVSDIMRDWKAEVEQLRQRAETLERERDHEHALLVDSTASFIRVRDELLSVQTDAATLRAALEYYADDERYDSCNKPVGNKTDKFQPSPDYPYIWDITRDRGTIAKQALAATGETAKSGCPKCGGNIRVAQRDSVYGECASCGAQWNMPPSG